MKAQGFILLVIGAIGISLPAIGGISYTCDATITVAQCSYLNTTVAGLYNTTFTNANATIYIQRNTAGLGESTGALNQQSYTAYRNALETESTDPAKATVLASEPALYGGGNVELTSALKAAMGIGGTTFGTEFDAGGSANTGWAGASCTTPGDGAVVVASASACYNGILTVATDAFLSTETSGTQGLWYRTGGPQPGNDYDFYSVVEHETDEILGTSSCYFTTPASAGPPPVPASISDGCSGTNVAPADLFRYSANGTRTLNTVGGTAYFSADTGATDYEGNLFDNAENGNDWADFSNSCTFVQDGFGCLGGSFDITTDNNGTSGAGPEVAILNAVGFNLAQSAIPEPGTLGLLGASFLALALGRKRLRRN